MGTSTNTGDYNLITGEPGMPCTTNTPYRNSFRGKFEALPLFPENVCSIAYHPKKV
ncbi:MAG: hypothetical protein MUF22_07965 [Chitinispirillaceae bacterium]|jgi:hypothetical protein|nr:hypothetical protein [Chitinispirillaceae bacterium]